MIAQFLFWGCTLGVIFCYVAYPLLVAVCAKCFAKADNPPLIPTDELPTVSLLVAAFNEEAVIRDRIKNALNLDYPEEKLDIVIATDGCTDRTCTIVEEFGEPRVRLMRFASRRGKSAVLNDAIPNLSGEIVLFSDANTNFSKDAVRKMVRWFASSSVGTVCGQLILVDGKSGKNCDGLYWRYENWIKASEGKLRALLGANGAIYAMRRSVIPRIPNDTLVDDFTLPLLAKLNGRCDIVFEPNAHAYEETAPDIRGEFRRRVRFGSGGAQAIARLSALLHPRNGWTAFAFFSHKLLRWACPVFLLVALAASCWLAASPFFAVVVAIQLVVYSVAVLGPLLGLTGMLGRVVTTISLFVQMNVALMLGALKWLFSDSTGVWARTPRSASIQADS